MNSYFFNNWSELESSWASFQNISNSLLVLVADQGKPDTEVFDQWCQSSQVSMFGGVFPELIVKGNRVVEGILILELPFRVHSSLIDIQTDAIDFFQQLENTYSAEPLQNYKNPGLFIFDDAVSERKNECIHSIYEFFGVNVKYIGGGAGSLKYDHKPCIFNNQGIFQDALLLALFDGDLALGVAHGWTPISEPLKITEADGYDILTIDWRPALDVYKELVEQHSGLTFTDHNFFEIAKSYPIGLAKMDDEMLVRDPYKTEGSSIRIVNKVHEGEHISIMHGNMSLLLEGAKSARLSVDKASHKGQIQEFCVDCITRVLYMGENFDQEIKIAQGENELNGILSLGEIANSGDRILEIFNKTIVLAKWAKTFS